MTSKLLNLNYKWASPETISWQVSDIGVNGKRIYDLNVRLSFECLCEIPQTNVWNRNNAPTTWKMLKYENGHFKKHIDHQVNPYHSGVDVLLPPRSLCSYQGGELVVCTQDEEKNFLPHDTMWTMIRIPLGTPHEVRPSVGARISFVRAVYSEKQFDYSPKGNEVQAIAVSD